MKIDQSGRKLVNWPTWRLAQTRTVGFTTAQVRLLIHETKATLIDSGPFLIAGTRLCHDHFKSPGNLQENQFTSGDVAK